MYILGIRNNKNDVLFLDFYPISSLKNQDRILALIFICQLELERFFSKNI